MKIVVALATLLMLGSTASAQKIVVEGTIDTDSLKQNKNGSVSGEYKLTPEEAKRLNEGVGSLPLKPYGMSEMPILQPVLPYPKMPIIKEEEKELPLADI